MIPKATVGRDAVEVLFSSEPAVKVEKFEIIADFDLEGAPIGFEAFGFKSPPLGETSRIDSPPLVASFAAEENALAVWFEKNPHSSDQEELEAELGFSQNGTLVFTRYKYQRGAAANRHRKARGSE